MKITGLHIPELAALIRAAEKHGGINKIIPCYNCGNCFDRRSIKEDRFWYNDADTDSTHTEIIHYEYDR